MRALWRSAGVRLALAYAVPFGLSALALVGFLWIATAGLLTRQVDSSIRADAVALSERWQEGGVEALQSTIQQRLVHHVQPDALYLLVNPLLQRVTGNLAAWPLGINHAGEPYELPVMRGDQPGLARLWRFDLTDGYHLLIGRDMQIRAALRQLVGDTLLWAAALVLVLGVAGALTVRGLFRRLLQRVSATAAAIEAGDLSQRVRLSGRGDELDRLAHPIQRTEDWSVL